LWLVFRVWVRFLRHDLEMSESYPLSFAALVLVGWHWAAPVAGGRVAVSVLHRNWQTTHPFSRFLISWFYAGILLKTI
jgi:hypothetical protein